MPMTTPKNVRLITNIDPTLDKVYFDRDKLDKILYNLLSNAVKYNKEGGRIMVAVEREGENMRLTVEDEGIGISKANLKRLYTRFLDGDYRKINATGTGIGISLTRDLVVLHHGTIDCQSRVGEGTRFTIKLPINKEAYDEKEMAENTIDEIVAENTFETVTKNIITDEIESGARETIEALSKDFSDSTEKRKALESEEQAKALELSKTYEQYIGKAHMNAQDIDRIAEMLQQGSATSIIDAVAQLEHPAQGVQPAHRVP